MVLGLGYKGRIVAALRAVSLFSFVTLYNLPCDSPVTKHLSCPPHALLSHCYQSFFMTLYMVYCRAADIQEIRQTRGQQQESFLRVMVLLLLRVLRVHFWEVLKFLE